MAKKSADKILIDSQLVIATAEKVCGWKNVHNGEVVSERSRTNSGAANGNSAQLFNKTVSAAVTDKRRRME
jgi:hypothetical protein